MTEPLWGPRGTLCHCSPKSPQLVTPGLVRAAGTCPLWGQGSRGPPSWGTPCICSQTFLSVVMENHQEG